MLLCSTYTDIFYNEYRKLVYLSPLLQRWGAG